MESNSVLSIRLRNFLQDDANRTRVDPGSSHEFLRHFEIVGINSVEERLDFADLSQLFKNQRAFEVTVIH